ncbi:MAG: HAD family hydrolase [Candidatus Aminicenantes bacterium]|nr:HAD family hydrolase [Candidatus Aminicenantes bacterium]
MTKRAVFLDRDGTINVDVGYPSRYDQVKIYAASFEALRKINAAGFLAVVVTNQSGIGRGFLTEDDLRDIHARMAEDFLARGARLDAFYYCPHYDLSEIPRYRLDCPCRKPKPEMARRAAAELGLDLSRSYMIGDKVEDVEFGLAAGASPILVRTGYGASAEIKLVERAITPAAVAGTLLEAVDWILEHDPERR